MRFAEVFDNVINDFKVNNAFAPQTALRAQLVCRFSALLCLTVDSIRRRTPIFSISKAEKQIRVLNSRLHQEMKIELHFVDVYVFNLRVTAN